MLASTVLLAFFSACSQEPGGLPRGRESMNDSGYKGNVEVWKEFLKCWETETLNKLKNEEALTEVEELILNRGGQKFAPADPVQISKKEHELEISLPTSYRDFLLASNGWLQPRLDDDDGMILPVEKIGYLSELYPREFKSMYKLEFSTPSSNDNDFSEEQDPTHYNAKDFSRAIAISDYVNNGVYLININKRSPEDEFVIWFYSSKHPGVYKYVSFAHIMQYAYIKTIIEPNNDIPYGHKYMEGTCAKLLGYPKLKKNMGPD